MCAHRNIAICVYGCEVVGIGTVTVCRGREEMKNDWKEKNAHARALARGLLSGLNSIHIFSFRSRLARAPSYHISLSKLGSPHSCIIYLTQGDYLPFWGRSQSPWPGSPRTVIQTAILVDCIYFICKCGTPRFAELISGVCAFYKERPGLELDGMALTRTQELSTDLYSLVMTQFPVP